MYHRVLVTGGTGFIGGNLARQLHNEGHDVTILARSPEKLQKIPDGMKFIEKDIRQGKIDVTNYDIIYHCASTVNDYNLLHHNSDDITTNCVGTYNLLESIRSTNPWTRLVFISTFFVNGDPLHLPVTEETPCFPKGLYGVTKKAAEDMCLAYHNAFDMDVVIARLTNVYGVNQHTASQRTAAFNWMIQSCVHDKTISLYDNGKIRRDYIYITDAISGIRIVAEKGESGELYLIGSGVGTSFSDMVHIMIRTAEGGKIRVVESPGFHKRVGIGDFWVDNTKVKKLGWSPLVSLDLGIMQTVSYYENLSNVYPV